MSIMQCLFASSLDSFIFIKSVTSSSSTITIPTEASEGDFAVLFDYAENTSLLPSAPTTVVPPGFTSVQNDTATFLLFLVAVRSIISYKVLNSSDSGTTITGMDNLNLRKILLIFRPNNKITTVSEVSNGDSGTGAPASQTISMSNQNTPIIGVSHWTSTDTIDPRTSDITMTEVNNGTDQYVKYIIYNLGNTPQNITVNMQDEGSLNTLQSAYFTFT